MMLAKRIFNSFCGEVGCVFITGWRPREDVAPSSCSKAGWLPRDRAKSACTLTLCGMAGQALSANWRWNGIAFPPIMPAGAPVLIRLIGLGQVKLCSLTDTQGRLTAKARKRVTVASGVQLLFLAVKKVCFWFCLFHVCLCQIFSFSYK